MSTSITIEKNGQLDIAMPAVATRSEWSEPILIAVWFGLLSGLVEGLVANLLRGVPGFAVRVSPGILWIAPAFNLVLFLLIGIAFAILFRLKRGMPYQAWVIGFFAWIAVFDLLLLLGKINQFASLILGLGVAVQLARMLRGRGHGALAFFRKTVPALIAAAILIGTAGAYWNHGRESYMVSKLPQPKPNSPNILFITLDTLRADHLSSYGYQRSTTPNLDKLAKRGAMFENAFANSSWTLPAHASMFTGLLPHEHKADWTQPLGKDKQTLAEELAARGYQTAAFAANTSYVSPEWGLGHGFTRFDVYGSSLIEDATSTVYGKKLALNVLPRIGYFEIPGRKRANQVNAEFLDWLSTVNGRPFFAFLNYFDLHDPYLTDAPFRTKFSDKVTNGELINFQFQATTFRRKPKLTDQEIQAEIDSYDGCLAYLDEKLGELFAELNRRGLDQNTLVIITSDHGEAFGNHDLFGHGNGLYVDTLHVPLIFLWPDRIPSDLRVSGMVSLHNIPFTVMSLLGESNGGSFNGSSLARLWEGSKQQEVSADVTAELSPGRFKDGPSNYPATKGGLKSLVTDRWHFIISESGQVELYAWRDDPNETRNLAEDPANRSLIDGFKQRVNFSAGSQGD